MANVLPLPQQKDMKRRIRARFILLAGLVILFGAIVAALSLAPTIVSLRISRGVVETETAQTAQAATGEGAIALRAQNIMTALKPIANATSSPSATIAAALSVRPNGISITSLGYAPGRLTLSGTAARREAVNDFRTALDANDIFTQVSVPVAALVGSQDGRFTITLTGAF